MQMSQTQKESLYKVLNTILLTIIAIFGVYSLVVLNTVDEKINEQKIQISILQTQLDNHQKESIVIDHRLTQLENYVYKIPYHEYIK